MAIKWKGWTARLAVKLCCITLIPVMAFVFLLGTLGLARMDTNYDAGILFTDFEDDDYFFDSYVPVAVSKVQTVFSYQSEELICNMGYLKWQPVEDNNSQDSSEEAWVSLVSTNTLDNQKQWGQVRASELESPEAKRLLEGAINNQLSDYYNSNEWLDNAKGLYFFIKEGERELTNLPPGQSQSQSVDFFRTQPVFLIQENGRTHEQSTQGENRNSYGYYDSLNNTTIYIAFTKEAVDAQNALWKSSQRQIAANALLMGVSALAALIMLIILMAGAGRRRADNGESVYFTVIDKPWLDFGFVALVFYEVAICMFISYSIEIAWRYDNIRWIVALCALLAVGFTLPIIGWVLSFVKRCKAGKWWRYTLIYTMFHWIYNKLRTFFSSLWSGVQLTAKVVLATFVSLVAMVVCIAVPPMCIVLAVGILLILLKYARRLHMVEQGAKNASSGLYDATIEVTGGELGSIANSINCISSGINSAVAERMKSERLKTELITNVSHDIRTPLTSLITYTDLLKTEGLDSENAPEYLDVLIQKSARLKTLTDDLFEATKAASGNIEVHLDSLDLADFVRQVLGELDERVSVSGLDFRLNLPEHALVQADGKLLWRVMDNLLSNVFKYAQKGSRVYIDVMRENGDYRLDVKNISEYELNVDPNELTERFKRGDSARADEGSGLGLSIAQSFMSAQGGRFALSIDGDLFKASLYLPQSQGDL